MTLVPPRYTSLRPIGSGSFASVYAAADSLLGRAVAIKILHDECRRDPAAHARFAREVRVGAVLGAHPFVVTLHDAGEWSGRPFLVMELLAGSVAEQREVDEQLALRWLVQAADALDYAHAHGIVHRDVKPANLLLDGSGDIRLADFGVARDSAATALTLPGHVVGTPGYVAPEVEAGRPATPASDIYALAVVARELLGERDALADALDPEPARRPPAAAALVRALGGGEPRTRVLLPPARRLPPIPVTQPAPVAVRPARRRRSVRVSLAAATIAALAACSAAGAAFLVQRFEPHRGAPAPAASGPLQTCALSPFKHDANIVVRGVRADTFCRTQAHVLQLEGDRWSYRNGGELFAPDHGLSALRVVCRLRHGLLAATVYDSGTTRIGDDVCSWYSSGGWA